MSSDIREALKQQIIEQHGKLQYSYTTDEKEINLLLAGKKRRQILSIILSVLTASPAVIRLFSTQLWWTYLSAFFGVVLMCLSIYSINSDTDSRLSKLKEVNDRLWLVREEYVALLIDFDSLEISEIQKRRDELTHEVGDVYKGRPKTSTKAYKMAQVALQKEEEQTFNDGEAEKLLPTSLRKR